MTKKAEKKKVSVQTKEPSRLKSRRGVIFVAFFLISAWMFFLGVLVGRGTAPVRFDIGKIHKELAFLKEQALKIEESAQEVNSEKDILEFYEALKKEYQNDPLVTRDPENDRLSKSAKKDYKKTKRIPETVRKVVEQKQKISDKNHFSIQVASSRDKKEADKLVGRYNQKGLPSYMNSVEVKDTGVWHRVKIGPYETLDEAGSILRKVKKLKSDAFIVKHD